MRRTIRILKNPRVLHYLELPSPGATTPPRFYTHHGTPSNGSSGTWAAEAPVASLLISTSTKKLYINTNTKASPTWTVVGAQT